VLSSTAHRQGSIQSGGQERGCGRRRSKTQPQHACKLSGIWLPCDASAVAKRLYWPFRHSRAPFGDLTGGLDRTHIDKSFDAPDLSSMFSRVNAFDFDVAIIGGGSGGYA